MHPSSLHFHHLCEQAFSCRNSSCLLFYRIPLVPPSRSDARSVDANRQPYCRSRSGRAVVFSYRRGMAWARLSGNTDYRRHYPIYRVVWSGVCVCACVRVCTTWQRRPAIGVVARLLGHGTPRTSTTTFLSIHCTLGPRGCHLAFPPAVKISPRLSSLQSLDTAG